MFTTENKILKYEELEKSCPKAIGIYKEWIKDTLEKFQERILKETNNGVEAPEITEDMVNTSAKSVILFNQRVLYDFFDGKDIYASVYYGGPRRWIYGINDEPTTEAEARQIAEAQVFKQCFEMLNNK